MTNRTWVNGEPSHYQLRDITRFPDWKNIIVWDAFFNNLAGGFYVFLILSWFFGASRIPSMNFLLPFGLTLGLVVLFFDLALLIFDLGDPFRFIHALRVFHPTSVLSVGVWALSTFALSLSIVVGLAWLMYISSITTNFMHPFLYAVTTTMKVFTAFAFISACVVLCYKGVVFSASAQPGIKEGRWLTTWMVSDAMLMGSGLFVIFAFCMGAYGAIFAAAIPMCVLIVIRCIGFYLLWLNTRDRAKKFYTGGQNISIFLIVFVVAGILPFVLNFFGPIMTTVAGILVLIAGVWERYWLIGMTKPLYGKNADLT